MESNDKFFCGGDCTVCQEQETPAEKAGRLVTEAGNYVFNEPAPSWGELAEKIERLTRENDALVKLVSGYQDLFKQRL